ncbi:50S ribosomal protein L24 [Propioniciclava sp. MC1595]|jgi:large subunit ribosomal protein L24|uniref:50S ribosomal protein L24 n=1 Tax=unclassified Propioniciclava TaxID=2642922 RepID=UPI001601C087|nr:MULTISPECIES: 50S ribosomal protein L24 [unclassified Propioniciclava]MBB1494305.1 50S ribosomal protein L24 [Propioniciclava sp. MC1595]MBB1501506.1 50S ribosomal protein L24 [Propioniciclava sp. MC1683]NLE17917.1 50S ribosomal protein L24 [Propioniciclava sp.]QTE25280.1 50S ribosomal protein L24 [Propioniciclava sp. MC1595]
MANSLHVKKGDTVKVIAGDDKGAIGEIIAVFPKEGRVIVEGVNLVKKHTAANPNAAGKNTGGIIETEAPIHASNVQLVTGSGKKAQVTRVGYKRVEVTKRRPDGTEYTATRSVRIARKTGEEI